MDAVEARLDAIDATLADHKARITALEASQHEVINVYNEAASTSGGTKGIIFEINAGGVYP